MEKRKDPDLIEKIAYGLPVDVRAEFLNEMRYLRSLPENDEILRILRAMMFLTLLTEQVPQRILTEREKLEYSCKEITATAKSIEKSGSEYYRKLNKQLTQLPADIAAGINPKAIVENINGSLKKQFDISTIPIVAQELAANAETIRTAASKYKSATMELSGQWRTAAISARAAIDNIRTTVSNAVETSERATKSFTRTFNKTYHWAIGIIAAGVLLTGIMIGIMIFDSNCYQKPYLSIQANLSDSKISYYCFSHKAGRTPTLLLLTSRPLTQTRPSLPTQAIAGDRSRQTSCGTLRLTTN